MAHEVESMFYVGKPPWHGLGKKVPADAAYDISYCIEAADLAWKVYKEQLETVNTRLLVPMYAVIRDSDTSVLGVVGESYNPVQNIDAFNIFQPFLDTKLASLETAGSLQQGKKVWILAKTGSPVDIVRNDPVELYILLSHAHDGSMKISFGLTPIRVVCMNTLRMALADNSDKLFKFKHTRNVLNNLESARETINLIHGRFLATTEQYKVLANTRITEPKLEEYVKTLFEIDEDASTRALNQVNKVIDYFESSPGNNLMSARGTLWAAYNAVTYYLNYDYGRNDDNRLNALWFGTSANLSDRALSLALEYV